MSTRINIRIANERLLQDSERRAAANRQALEDRTQLAKEQQAAEQAAEQAAPEESPSAVPDIRLERRIGAQRRSNSTDPTNPTDPTDPTNPTDPTDLKPYLDPVYIIPQEGPIKGGFTYTVFTGSRGAIFGVTPLVEPGLPSVSTGIVPGHQEAYLQAAYNYQNDLNRVRAITISSGVFLAQTVYVPVADTSSQKRIPVRFDSAPVKNYRNIYSDQLIASFVVDDVLSLIFYRNFNDMYDVVYRTAYDTTAGGLPITVKSNSQTFSVRARATTDCFVVTLNLTTGASTKNNFMFHEYKHIKTLKSVRIESAGYYFWNSYTENIFTKELLTFLSESTYIPNFNFSTLPLFVGTEQQNYNYTHTDNVSDLVPAASVTDFFNPYYYSVLNVKFNNLVYGQPHTLSSFLPYGNPLYTIIPGDTDTYGFIDYPRWEGYNSQTGTRVISAGSFVTADGGFDSTDFEFGMLPNLRRDLLEVSKTTKPANAQQLKQIGYPWPQSFNTYNDKSKFPLNQLDTLRLDSFSDQTRSAFLSSQQPPYIAVAKDPTAPDIQPLEQRYVVNGPWYELGVDFYGTPRAIPFSIRAYSATLRRVMYHIVGV